MSTNTGADGLVQVMSGEWINLSHAEMVVQNRPEGSCTIQLATGGTEIARGEYGQALARRLGIQQDADHPLHRWVNYSTVRRAFWRPLGALTVVFWSDKSFTFTAEEALAHARALGVPAPTLSEKKGAA